jgi:UDP-N-acetyl-D-glucosamine dehydrogenase
LEETGLKVGEEFFLAYSPERVDPGNKVFNTKNTPKVVGGVTPECTEIAAALYRSVLEGEVHVVSSPKVAEMEKILENTFRNINIALVNEMAILCNKMGIDIWEVIDAAKTKPYGYMAFYPGPGLGGHCIPIDPFYLTWKAREYNYHTRLIEVAGEINNEMPEFVVDRIMKVLNRYGKALNGAKVAVLGVAYKKDIDDYRESPVIEIVQLLEKYQADFVTVDPHISTFRAGDKEYETVPLTEELLESSDLVLITTDHSAFDYELIAKKAKVIFDTRNALKDVQKIEADYEKL